MRTKGDLDALEHEAARWPQLPDSQFYGRRNQIMLLIMSLRNYGTETMIREDYTLRGSEFDPLEFSDSMVYDTWTEEAISSLFHAFEGITEIAYQHDEIPPREEPTLEAKQQEWRDHMTHLARTALRARHYNHGSRHMDQWFADAVPSWAATVPTPTPTSENAPPTSLDDLDTFEDIYRQAFEDENMWDVDLAWDGENRLVAIRDRELRHARIRQQHIEEIIEERRIQQMGIA